MAETVRRGRPPKVPVQPIREIAKRYAEGSGDIVSTLAAENGVCRKTIYNWMLAEYGEEYRELGTAALIGRILEADAQVEKAARSRDPVLMTARIQQAKFARFDYERRRPEMYGPKQEVKHTGAAPTLNIVLLDRPTGVVEEKSIPDSPALPAPVAEGAER